MHLTKPQRTALAALLATPVAHFPHRAFSTRPGAWDTGVAGCYDTGLNSTVLEGLRALGLITCTRIYLRGHVSDDLALTPLADQLRGNSPAAPEGGPKPDAAIGTHHHETHPEIRHPETAPAAPAVLPLGQTRRARRTAPAADAGLPHAGLVDALAQAIDAAPAPEATPSADGPQNVPQAPEAAIVAAPAPRPRRPRSPRRGPATLVRTRLVAHEAPAPRSAILVLAETIDHLEGRLRIERARLLALLAPSNGGQQASAPARRPRRPRAPKA